MKLMTKKLCHIILIILVAVFFNSCGIYSFTGANISPDIKTIYVGTFFNDAGNGPPNMTQILTEQLKDYYQQNTSLAVVNDSDADLIVEGSIVSYVTRPEAPSSSQNQNVQDVSEFNRLTITVNVSYINTKDDTFNFENKKFSFFELYPSVQPLSSVENQLVTTIFEAIVYDIFNATVANW